MFDIQIGLKPNNNTETMMPSVIDNNISSDGNFAKLLDEVKNSYEASSKIAEEQSVNQNESFLRKIKNMFSGNKKGEKSETKSKKNTTSELSVTTEQLLLNSQLALISSITGRDVSENNLPSPQISENNTSKGTEVSSDEKQSIDVMTNMIKELKNTQAVKTQTPLKTNDTFALQTEDENNAQVKIPINNTEKFNVKNLSDKISTENTENIKVAQNDTTVGLKEINSEQLKNIQNIKKDGCPENTSDVEVQQPDKKTEIKPLDENAVKIAPRTVVKATDKNIVKSNNITNAKTNDEPVANKAEVKVSDKPAIQISDKIETKTSDEPVANKIEVKVSDKPDIKINDTIETKVNDKPTVKISSKAETKTNDETTAEINKKTETKIVDKTETKVSDKQEVKISSKNEVKNNDKTEINFSGKSDYSEKLNDKTLVKISSIPEERNIKIESNTNNRNSLTLQDIQRENIKFAASETSDDSQNETSNYDFNSSSFENLSSHLTKLSLNKTADFSKVLNNKISKNTPAASSKSVDVQPVKSSGSVNLVLRPENLGRVNVNLTSANGIVSAELIAENPQAADTLNKNIDELRQNLIEQGIKVGDVNVKVTQASQSESFSNDRSFKDNLASSQQNTFNKHHGKSFASNNNQTYYNNNDIDEENTSDDSEYLQTNRYNTNKNLEIYNNMGRTL